ncbi:hypothetical protein [Mesorhizobium sp.]|uniref:hypothetical protein n=1 Tax=Mesorhizobium sp. TaxID=1871066 RepID=UPI0025C2CEBD|nr:hypothetical protein [Mesorhizobium sp.]
MTILRPPASLGFLELERGLAPGEKPPQAHPGSLLNPATYDFPIIIETVEGAWADRVIRGDPSLELAYVAAAQRLVERGAVAMIANCGFAIRHQAAVAASVNVPVALSSLLLIPTLLRQLSPGAKLAVLTADSTHCSEDLFGIDDAAERARIVVGGIEGGKLLENEMQRPPRRTPVSEIEDDVKACVMRLRKKHPDIAAFLFECTAFPLVSPVIRQMTGLPVYDTVTLSRMTFTSAS